VLINDVYLPIQDILGFTILILRIHPQYISIYGYIFVYLGYKYNNPNITNYESVFIKSFNRRTK